MITCVAAMPSMPGMRISMSTTSGRVSRTRATAAPPLSASATILMSPSRSASAIKPLRRSASSSAITTRIIANLGGEELPGR